MTEHTRDAEKASKIALQMRWAHKALGTWEAVARLCGVSPRTGRPVSPALAWWWASGRRPIPDAVAEAWQANVSPAMLKSWEPRRRSPRVSIECSPHIRDALRRQIKQETDTWDSALGRVLADAGQGSAPHLFSALEKDTLLAIRRDLDNLGAGSIEHDAPTIRWWLGRLDLELSMRETPDWAREE